MSCVIDRQLPATKRPGSQAVANKYFLKSSIVSKKMTMKSDIDALPAKIRMPMRLLGFINVLILCAIGIAAAFADLEWPIYAMGTALVLVAAFFFFIIVPRLVISGKHVSGFVFLLLPMIGTLGFAYWWKYMQVV